ncbi:MAG TPA: PAS domain-containing protein, partial [Hyphomicrobiales bacterium]|nr:PAS domain-containing protein [Hyphomicrobiales bacterium]
MIEDKSRTNRASEAARAGDSGWFPASREAIFGRIRRQKWVLLTAFFISVAAAYAGASGLVAAAGWLLLAAAALLSPSGPPASNKMPMSQRLARPKGADDWALIAAVPDPCLLLSADGRILDHNAAASELFGRIQAGRPVSALLRAPEIGAALGQAQSTGEAARVDYFERVPIDRWFEAHIAPIGEGKGDRRGAAYLLLLHDRTEQQRVERMRVDFIANAS